MLARSKIPRFTLKFGKKSRIIDSGKEKEISIKAIYRILPIKTLPPNKLTPLKAFFLNSWKDQNQEFVSQVSHLKQQNFILLLYSSSQTVSSATKIILHSMTYQWGKGGGLLGGQNNKFVIQLKKLPRLIRKNTVCIFLEMHSHWQTYQELILAIGCALWRIFNRRNRPTDGWTEPLVQIRGRI